MNKDRRKKIDAAIAKLEALKGPLEEAKSELETARDEEQEYYDNMPENMQSGEKGENAEADVNALDNWMGSIDEFINTIDAIQNDAELDH